MYKASDDNQKLFDWLSTYRVRRSETAVERAAPLAKVEYAVASAFFKELAELEIGEFKLGRRGQKTRIAWWYSPGGVGEAAKGMVQELLPYDEEEFAEIQADDAPETAPPVGDPRKAILKAKRALAEELGIDANAIEITIKF